MKKLRTILSIIPVLTIMGCNSTKSTVIPLTEQLVDDDAYTIIWNGISKAYRFENDAWQRAETYDYRFNVVQKRFDDRWKSVKTLHRLHPGYDGAAGERSQTMYFELHYHRTENGRVASEIFSSLGNGSGRTDTEFREAELTMSVPGAGKFMPYNTIRISQQYLYEKGELRETVMLVKKTDDGETPFMKMEEIAQIFLEGKLESAPTRFP